MLPSNGYAPLGLISPKTIVVSLVDALNVNAPKFFPLHHTLDLFDIPLLLQLFTFQCIDNTIHLFNSPAFAPNEYAPTNLLP